MKKVVVGLSGGVDSAVAASLLKDEYEVTGVTLQMQGDCFSVSDIEDAKSVAEKLGIEHEVIDCSESFMTIKQYFADAYLDGKTPNPCVLCNPKIKWAALCEYADKIGAEYVATGHYAYVDRLENGRYALRSADSRKDQTYVLYGLGQEQLKRTLMPLGRFENKERVRAIAKELGLQVSDKPDSMEVCFIPDNDYAGYIERTTGQKKPEGNFIDSTGNVLGKHKGIINYTIGQRKGLGIAFGEPMFVKEIRPETNEVVLDRNESLFTKALTAENVNLMSVSDLPAGTQARARIRYAHKGEVCEVVSFEEGRLEIRFNNAVRAVTPGQSVVLYDEDGHVMAGGIIAR